MENNENTVENVEEKDVKGTGEVTQPNNEEVKTFTQEEVDKIVKKRLKDIPSEKELTKYREWLDAQKTEAEKAKEKEAEYNKLLAQVNEKNNENTALKAGVNPDDLDYVIFKVSKMDGDFDDNLADFLKDNPKFKVGYEQKVQATGVSIGQQTVSNKRSGVADILASKHPEIKFD